MIEADTANSPETSRWLWSPIEAARSGGGMKAAIVLIACSLALAGCEREPKSPYSDPRNPAKYGLQTSSLQLQAGAPLRSASARAAPADLHAAVRTGDAAAVQAALRAA